MFVTEAYAAAPNPGNGPQQAPGLGNILPMMIAMFVIIYFFMIRPQSKKQKETRKMLEELKKGDKVVTVGGILGLVTNVKGNIITLKVAPDVEIDFRKSAIASVVTAELEKDLKGEPEKK